MTPLISSLCDFNASLISSCEGFSEVEYNAAKSNFTAERPFSLGFRAGRRTALDVSKR